VANSGTKLLIVGTITPPGAGYFYCSKYNRIFGYLDERFGTDLKSKKLEVADPGTREKGIDDIKRILRDKNIAFLDVMKEAIRKNKSPSDKDILYYTLDYGSFEKKIGEGTIIIVNSRLAEEGFVNIAQSLKLENKAEYVPQRGGTKKLWVQTLEEAYFRGALIPGRQI